MEQQSSPLVIRKTAGKKEWEWGDSKEPAECHGGTVAVMDATILMQYIKGEKWHRERVD